MFSYELTPLGELIVWGTVFHCIIWYCTDFLLKSFMDAEDIIFFVNMIPGVNIFIFAIAVFQTVVSFVAVPFWLQMTIFLMLRRKDYVTPTNGASPVIINNALGISIYRDHVVVPEHIYHTSRYQRLINKIDPPEPPIKKQNKHKDLFKIYRSNSKGA